MRAKSSKQRCPALCKKQLLPANCCILVAAATVTQVAEALSLLQGLKQFCSERRLVPKLYVLSEIRMLGFKMASKIILFWN